ncbi:MarR family transcriptional regulator [Jiangella mangrovi]|uniref:DNA-binding transcriptional ArsR family regulator n=1 Tax=Jiangella mangrovi TaxID=1524084 RepID=A0A7W9GUU9_9ACTN|nr:MarR family transcriptional regulator [Jiangella mangrovi]MBB5790086.1 DNA-binding transcriptional ArsR family regulator [Jiangella mangrovi]
MSAPSLLPLLRTQTQGVLLAWLYLHPEERHSLTDLARRLGVSVSTIHREADRLVEAGLLTDSHVGRSRLVQARTDTAVFQPLADLLAVTYGPIPVLTGLLSGFPGVLRAYVYGSWAARYQGHGGEPPNDVDVLVVGTPDRDDLYDVAAAARQQLGREVNIRQISAEVWDDPEPAGFVATVRSRPIVELDVRESAPA